MRQIGHPLTYKPEDKLLEGFVLQGATMKSPTILKIINAWKQFNKGKESLKKPREESTIPYAQWMRERVCIIKLPFALNIPVEPRAHVPVMISKEDGNTLNATIFQLRKENEELEEKFYRTTCEKNKLNIDLNKALEQLKGSEEMTILEEDKKEKAYANLRVISSSLTVHKDELDRAWR